MAPPSKSMAHRKIIAACLGEGERTVSHVDLSEDICATIRCMQTLGASVTVEGSQLRIRGIDLLQAKPQGVLDCGECGTTLRLLIPLALLTGEQVTFTGSTKLLSRPLSVYEELCRERGFLWKKTEDTLTVQGRLTSGTYTLPGDVSSQFVSGMCFALALLAGESTLLLTHQVESKPYIEMTLQVLQACDVAACFLTDTKIYIRGGTLVAPNDAFVEGDWSNAAPWFALQQLGDPVSVSGVNCLDTTQGDRVCETYFREMIEEGCPLSVADCPDLAPILMAFAACTNGVELTHTDRLRFKESDRGSVMAEELRKCGIQVDVDTHSIRVFGGGLQVPNEVLSGHNDHRIVMALSILLTRVGGKISQCESVNKSYPAFFEDMRALGIACSFSQEP